jgi:hemerythrin superfamily protein
VHALTVLERDHRTVEDLFTRFEQASRDDTATLAEIRDQIIRELSVHAVIEELVFYPGVREADPELEDMVLEGLEEHHGVKVVLSELEKLLPTAERFRPKMTVLIENVRHHVKEEEEDIFPKVREKLTEQQLTDMGEALEKAKETAPTRPHPFQPDQPPLNALLGAPVAAFDRVVTTARQAVERVLASRKAS